MRAGEKNRRIRIEYLTISKSASGAPIEVWTLLKLVWAKISFIRGTERNSIDKTISEAFTLFKIDFINGLSPKNHRVIYNGQIYDIFDVSEVGYREASLLNCRIQKIQNIGSGFKP